MDFYEIWEQVEWAREKLIKFWKVGLAHCDRDVCSAICRLVYFLSHMPT